MIEFITNDGFFYFYSAILQGFAALLGILIIGIMFKLNGLEEALDDKIMDISRYTLKYDENSYKAIIKKARDRLMSFKNPDFNSGFTSRLSEGEIDKFSEFVNRYDMLIDKSSKIRRRTIAPVTLTIVIIIYSAFMIIARNSMPLETIIILSVIAFILIIVGLVLYWKLIYDCFIKSDKSEIYEKIII